MKIIFSIWDSLVSAYLYFLQSLDSLCIGEEWWNSMQQSLVQTWAQHIHILKMLHRWAPTAHFQVNYSYSIYAKHELQQSLEKIK